MLKNRKEYFQFTLTLLIFCITAVALFSSGCASQTTQAADTTIDVGDNAYTEWKNDTYTTIKLEETKATVDGDGAEAKDSTVTISKAGTYVISGKLTNGSIVVNSSTDGTVRLVLNGAEIHSETSSPIYIKDAGKAIISLEPDTTNTLSDGTNRVYDDTANSEPDAVVFSKSDLSFNGTGSLTVTAQSGDGIKCKDALMMVEGTYTVTSADDGIVGRDSAQFAGGTYTVKATGDGIKATNDEDASQGKVLIGSGTYTITAGADGIQAVTDLTVKDGQFTINTGGGSANALTKTDTGMDPGMKQSDETSTTTDTGSYKGFKSSGTLTLDGGTYKLDTKDDAVHANDSVTINQGTLDIASGDDGIHADNTLTINNGTLTISKSYEGLEGSNITIKGGTIKVTASDDGVNVAGGDGSSTSSDRADASDFSSTSSNNTLTMDGGTLIVSADGDGLDANGSITMTGGTVLVDGPTNDGNAALDYDGTFDISGGTFVAAGSSGMAQAPSTSSTQGAICMTFTDAQNAGTMVNVSDSSGKSLISYTPSKTYSNIVISSPDIKKGSSYSLSTGGSDNGTQNGELVTGGTYSGGSQVVSYTQSDTVIGLSPSGVTDLPTGMNGGGGGQGQGDQGGGAPGGGGPGGAAQ